MGIFFLVEKFDYHFTVGFGIHLLAFLYFIYAHRTVFAKSKQSGTSAVVLGIIGLGLGQAYNRQAVKALICFAIPLLLSFISQLKWTNEDVFMWSAVVFFVLTLIDAGLGAEKAERRLLVKNRMTDLKAMTKVITNYRQQGKKFAVDTNILMHEPDLLVYLLEKEQMDLYMSMMVFNELDGLKENTNYDVRRKAQFAFDVIEAFQKQKRLHMLKTPKTTDIRKYRLGGSPDEKIIGTYLREIKEKEEEYVFLSNDKGARIIARNVGLPVVEF